MTAADDEAEVTRLVGWQPMDGGIQPGALLCNGTYRIEERLGAGGMGEVYRGVNTVTGAPCAIKTIRREYVDDQALRGLFVREAEALKSIRDNAVVGYEGVFRDETGRVLIVMDHVDGPSLAERMRAQPLTVEETERLARRLARGLAAAHRMGVHHRDLSPDNVLLPGGRLDDAVLIDFGIARREGSGPTMLGTGPARGFTGKLAYASPEQAGAVDAPLDQRSDIYSLGLVLAAAARGRPLPMGTDVMSAMAARKRRPDLSSLPKPLQRLLDPLLAPDPKDRPQSLDGFAGRADAVAPRRLPASRRSSARRPWPVLTALAAILIGSVVGGAAWLLLQEPAPPPVKDKAPPQTAPENASLPRMRDDAALGMTLASVPCAQLAWSPAPSGGITLTGTLPDVAARRDLMARLTALPDVAPIEDRTRTEPLAHCEAGARIAALIGASDLPAPEIVLNRPDGVFHADSDVFVATVRNPAATPVQVYLDFFDQDGKVYHLLPEPLARDNRVLPGSTVQVGHGSDLAGEQDRVWRLSEPYGLGLVVATVSERPLYDGLRAIGEDSAAYLAFLASAVPKAARGGRLAMSEVQIETRSGR